MILDKENAFSESQSLTGTSLVASTNLIDLSAVRQIGAGNQQPVLVVNFEAQGGTTPTMTLALQTDDNASFSSAATPITYLSAAAAASWAAGSQVKFPLPMAGLERYVRLAYTMGGTSPTATVSAHLALEAQDDVKYPSGFSVA